MALEYPTPVTPPPVQPARSNNTLIIVIVILLILLCCCCLAVVLGVLIFAPGYRNTIEFNSTFLPYASLFTLPGWFSMLVPRV